MTRTCTVALLWFCFVGCGRIQISNVPSTHKYEPFGKYVIEIETVGSTGFKTSVFSSQSGDEVTQRAEYEWEGNSLKLDNGKLTFNGQDCGTLEDKDQIQVDAKGKLTVNGKPRP